MEYKYRFVEDDPCHGCRCAVRVPDEQLESLFQRRYRCADTRRIVRPLNRLRLKICQPNPNLEECKKAWDELWYLHSSMDKKGTTPCEDGTIHPFCYQETEQ